MSTAEKTQTIKDLRATADVIEKNGLTKHALYDRFDGKPPAECRVCAIGAINITVWGQPFGPTSDQYDGPMDEFRALNSRQIAVEDALAVVTGISDLCIPDWNDAPERTQDEVIAAFRAAADALEAS